MSIVRYNVTARNTGVPTASLTPVWNTLVVSATGVAVPSPNTAVPIIALSGGGYQIAYDPTAGELYGIIDFGSQVSDPNERYADITLAADPNTLIALASAIVAGFSLNLAQAVPTSNALQTVGDALNAALSNGFGKEVLSGTTLTRYAHDSLSNPTAVRTFTLDSGTAPTQRS